MKFNIRTSLFATIAVLSVCITSASAYVILNILSNGIFSWSRFASILGLLNLVNLLFIWHWWLHKDRLSLRAKLTIVLWGSLVIWYWLIAPIYFYLVMNLNTLQLQWTAFAFLWEVPILGGLFVLLSLLLFRPIHRLLNKDIPPTNPEKFYQWSLDFPIVISLLLFLVSLLGYFVGALQLRFLAAYPVIEQIKNIMNGFVISVFLATFYYLVVDQMLNQVRIQIEKATHLHHPPRRKIKNKVLAISLLTSLGSLALIGLFVFKSYQLVIGNLLTTQVTQDLNLMLDKSKGDLRQFSIALELKGLTYGRNGLAFLVQEPIMNDPRFSPETIDFINDFRFGVIRDLHYENKIVAVAQIDSIDSKLISIIYPADYYAPLLAGASPVIFASIFVFVITLSVTAVFSHFITYAITLLTQEVNKVKRKHVIKNSGTLLIGSADEVQDLSTAFVDYATENETLERLKNEFISVAAHQLRTPAGIIKWSLEEFLAKKYGKLSDTQREVLEKTFHTNERMIRLINNLLDVSRIDQKRVTDEPELIDIGSIIAFQISEFKTSARKKKLALRLIKEPGVPKIMLDKNRMVAVIQNLLSNAIKYTNEGSIEFRLSKLKRHIKLTVTDTGIGIPELAKGDIFTKFFRAENAVATDPDGSGLGLHIVKTYVEAWGGNISFASAIGQGTSFHITIPLEPQQHTLTQNINQEEKHE